MKATVIAVFAVLLAVAAAEDTLPEEIFGECPPIDGLRPVYLMDKTYREVFYECQNGIPIRQNCSEGLVFDPRINVCNYPSIDCEHYGPVGVCPGNNNYPIFLRDGTNLGVYYRCYPDEGAVKFVCENSYYFDMVTKKCKYFA